GLRSLRPSQVAAGLAAGEAARRRRGS
ncbi:DUF4255 domain-containing protein, partial [Streptomyces sp. EAG2]